MVVRRKDRLLGVLSLEHTGRVRDADIEAAAGRVGASRFDHRASRMLFQNIPDHLDRVDVALAFHELDRLVQPADRRSERRPPGADLPFPLQRAQRIPELRLADLLHLDVMNLQNVDVVRG